MPKCTPGKLTLGKFTLDTFIPGNIEGKFTLVNLILGNTLSVISESGGKFLLLIVTLPWLTLP